MQFSSVSKEWRQCESFVRSALPLTVLPLVHILFSPYKVSLAAAFYSRQRISAAASSVPATFPLAPNDGPVSSFHPGRPKIDPLSPSPCSNPQTRTNALSPWEKTKILPAAPLFGTSTLLLKAAPHNRLAIHKTDIHLIFALHTHSPPTNLFLADKPAFCWAAQRFHCLKARP